MNPIPNPVHMVDGRVMTKQITLPPEIITHITKLFDNPATCAQSITVFANPTDKQRNRSTIECSTRDDVVRALYMKLDEFVLCSLLEWGSDVYMGVAREQFMMYPPGVDCRMHIDDQNEVPERLGKSKYLMHLMNQVAGLLWISSPDIEGGDFVLPNQQLVIPPITGTMACFPSNYLYPHEVTPVTKGYRISLARHYYVRDLPRV